MIEVIRTQAHDAILGKARGEAVALEVPGVGTLFLLLRGKPGDADWAFTMPHHALKAQLGSIAMVDPVLLDKLQKMQGLKIQLTPELYPLMVWFRDIDNPTTVQQVDPNNLAADFGAGVHLRRITVEITDDPVTVGIARRLPWLNKPPELRLDSNYRGSTSPNLSQRLMIYDFIKGKE